MVVNNNIVLFFTKKLNPKHLYSFTLVILNMILSTGCGPNFPVLTNPSIDILKYYKATFQEGNNELVVKIYIDY